MNRLVAACLAAAAVAAFTAPARAAGQDESAIVAGALLSPQIEAQVAQFSEMIENVSSVKVEQQNDLDKIELSGTILRGGDIACGHATLTIDRTFQLEPGAGMKASYTASIESVNVCPELQAPRSPMPRRRDDPKLVASALISRQIRGKAAEFGGLVKGVSAVKVEELNDLDTVEIEGQTSCGPATMSIQRTFQRGFGFGMVARYTAAIERKNSCAQ